MSTLEVILLQNMVIRHQRFRAGSKIVIDEAIGKCLVENDMAYEVPMIEPEPVVVKPKTKASKKVAK